MEWAFRIVIEIIATLIAYITNPFVVLFADDYGELPKWAKWWAVYDNRSLDIEWMITEGNVPSFARYDYGKHYIYHCEQKEEGLLIAGYVELIDRSFTVKERIQRYVCRLCWLYRNTNYGFSYYVNGKYIDSDRLVVIKDVDEPNNRQYICYESGKNIWDTVWCVFYCRQYCKWFRIRIYLGWKLKGGHSGRHMLALMVNPFKPLEIEG